MKPGALTLLVLMTASGAACTAILGMFDDDGTGTGGMTGQTSSSTSSGSSMCPACQDNMMDCDETDTDCGGPTCPKCSSGSDCLANSDCDTDYCYLGGTSSECYPKDCGDGVRDGSESDVDCGGSDCPPCSAGKHCGTTNDCVNDCVNHVCD